MQSLVFAPRSEKGRIRICRRNGLGPLHFLSSCVETSNYEIRPKASFSRISG